MNYIISIVGTTASGKSEFAYNLAKKILSDTASISTELQTFLPSELLEKSYQGVDILSADSRQIYSEIPIISGADVPEHMNEVTGSDFEYPYFQSQTEDIRLHGVAMLDRFEDWSVSHFKNFAIPILKNSWKTQRLPIVVGGTGLYHQQLYSTYKNLFVPPNESLRKKAENMEVTELQSWLKDINPKKISQMNHSDINNPRRLVRAIEIALGEPQMSKVTSLNKDNDFMRIQFGLKYDLNELEKRIAQRVKNRIENGAIQEAKSLQNFCQNQDNPICGTLGLSDLFSYLNDEIDLSTCIENWSLHEYQYAKRQLTWFQKNPDIIWLDSIKKTQYTEG